MTSIEKYNAHPRTADNLEVMRRWEEVRQSGWLTEEQKIELRKTKQEHILLINEQKEFELAPYRQITGDEPGVRAFVFERGGENWVVYWHTSGDGVLELPLPAGEIEVKDELWAEAIAIEGDGSVSKLPVGGRRYIRTKLSMDAVEKAFAKAVVR